jgi:hypothetical protein
VRCSVEGIGWISVRLRGVSVGGIGIGGIGRGGGIGIGDVRCCVRCYLGVHVLFACGLSLNRSW